ncbi:MAG: histidine kinase [Pedobacter sp.]|jgi:signal transduction histidine kinase|nr:histidine kinase [Pedobacter sp.]
MHNSNLPIPENEMQRLLSLSDLDLDYSNLEDNFNDLTLLAAKVAGTEISLINLLDSFTQWTIANHGLQVEQMPREESACQYTIMNAEPFEVPDLSIDERFRDKFFVDGPLSLRYYFGLPLKTAEGTNIGALCVLDTQLKTLTPEKIELLEVIGQTVVKRLQSYRALDILKDRLRASNESKKKVAHDIRGPLAGIIGLSNIITDQGNSCDVNELIELVAMINKSSKTILELADEILSVDINKPLADNELNLVLFREKLIKLYSPQARYKNIILEVDINSDNQNIPFSKNKLLQITGNLISNAIKFTPAGGRIKVKLDLIINVDKNLLNILVSDNGVGIDPTALNSIIKGNSSTSIGTLGETGFGFGLSLVSHLVESLNGSLDASSELGKGTRFKVILPQSNPR